MSNLKGDIASLAPLFIIGITVALFLGIKLLRPKLNAKEPPLIHSRIPFIGHIIGLVRRGTQYYAIAGGKIKPPAFTLDFLFMKIYVINTTKLVSAVQRNHRTISFDPFLRVAAERVSGIRGKGLRLLVQEPEKGGHSLNNALLHAMHPALLGSGLDGMNRNMIVNLQASIDGLAAERGAFDLHMWCRRVITIASTDAVYGALNPYKSQKVQDAFWDYESNLVHLILKIMPRFTARRAFLGRETLVSAFLDYFAAGGHENSSEMTYARWKVQRDAGASTADIARLEAAAGIGILSNTVPSTFWALFEIYSRLDLLADLRKEIIDNALSVDGQGDEFASGVHVIDLAKIRDGCHNLVSTFQEMLRMRSNAVLTRVVCKDIMLNDEYHLKAGSVLQMSAHPINREHSSWGDDSDRFDAGRFMAQDDPAAKVRHRMKGYLSFGASPNICPGRHFASGEILALVAMVILRYDITPENGAWDQPKLNSKAVAATALPPLDAFNVKATEREEYAGTTWAFRVTEGKGKFNLVTG